MFQNILVVLFSVNVLQGECTTVDLFKIPDPNKPCHLEIVKRFNNDTDHSGSRVIDTDVKSQLISTHLLFSITRAAVKFSNLRGLIAIDCIYSRSPKAPSAPPLTTVLIPT